MDLDMMASWSEHKSAKKLAVESSTTFASNSPSAFQLRHFFHSQCPLLTAKLPSDLIAVRAFAVPFL